MMTQTATQRHPDLMALAFWGRPEQDRLAAFAQLRAEPGPVWFPIPKVPLFPPGEGAYALVTHADVSEASHRPKLFSNEPTANSMVDMPRWFAQYFGSMINMDDPRHAQIRRVVAQAFTPRRLESIEPELQRRATRIVDELIATGPRDFVDQVAARLPVEVICDLLGIPDEYQRRIVRRTNVILGNTDPEYIGLPRERLLAGTVRQQDMMLASARLIIAGRDLVGLVRRLGQERRRQPTDDVISLLVNANVDGESLTPQELGSFFILLVVAGNETTRTALAHALHLFTVNKDQRDLLLSDFDGHIAGAVEEILRYSTPVIQFRRTVTQDCELNGREFHAGDKVVLFYNSANRDETVFPDPDRFDITRSPNRHVSFGGPGPHYCLGAHLARRELTVMLRELFIRLPDIRTTGEPERLLSNFVNGIKRMPFDFTNPDGEVAALGPDSLTWRYFGDTRMLLVGPRAGVLQNMLPALGQGVLDHSVFFSETFARLRRSVGPILNTVYGGSRAAETGHKVRDFHVNIKGKLPNGTRYHALDPETYYWAHATFLDNMMYGIETFVRPLSLAEKEEIYRESKVWFRMYGVSDRTMPQDWDVFQTYWQKMLDDQIVAHKTARYGVGYVRKGLPAPPKLPGWLWRAVRSPANSLAAFITTGGMPPSTRRQLDLPWTAAHERRYRRFSAVVRRTDPLWRMLPEAVRYLPQARKAFARDGRPRRS
jgi:cytochrome P450/uncharacterized protein (DUF2236 family)